MTGITVNGKFLGGQLNGVHRTAALYTQALLAHDGDDAEVEIVAPRPVPEGSVFGSLSPRVLPSRLGSGQGWEMIALPMATRDRLLVNLCNLAPVLHPNYVVMIHDAQTYLYPQDYSGRQAAAYRMLLPLIARRARRVLTVSEFARRTLDAHGVAPADKISVVHNGTDHLKDVAPDDSVLARHGLVPGAYAMALGSAKSYKNIPRLFAAFDHPDLCDLPLVVAGGPPAEAYARIGAVAPANARFLGPVTDAELRALYSNATMFLFPSRTEGFGLPPVEAMGCGCAVISADAGAMPEICGKGALLVDPEDTLAWRAAILRFRDPSARQAFAADAAQRADHFSWQRAGARLREVVSEYA
ncbi:D-inositol 3-phosphate glycosyltransferase [Marinibacterium anthonyi]|nr:D-inositol 3-phosphate glycosyltransferase [Marinibacterium anthonyi]